MYIVNNDNPTFTRPDMSSIMYTQIHTMYVHMYVLSPLRTCLVCVVEALCLLRSLACALSLIKCLTAAGCLPGGLNKPTEFVTIFSLETEHVVVVILPQVLFHYYGRPGGHQQAQLEGFTVPGPL